MARLQRIRLAVVLLMLGASSARGQPPAPAEQTVAVLNFVNRGQGDPAWDWLGKGLADLTIGDMAGQKLRVVSREQMAALVREIELTRAEEDPQAVARVLKATRCVHGSYLVAGQQITLNGGIVDVDSGKLVHAAEASGPVVDVLGLEKQLAAELIDVLQGNKPGTIDPAKLPQWTDSLLASQWLYRGIDLFDRGEYLRAWSLFRRALGKDPHYADGRYWAGRMMYYVQEYQQADIDLHRFVQEHPSHPRVGDAVMEIVNAVQQTASEAQQVLEACDLAAQLAPAADVANQFGPGKPSTVPIYAASVAGPILRAQADYSAAFRRYAAAIENLPRDGSLYWNVWHEVFTLGVDHLRATGELLTLPPKPTASVAGLDIWSYGKVYKREDELAGRAFHRLTPDQATVEVDFGGQPITYHNDITATQYFYTSPEHYLDSLVVEVTYEPEPQRDVEFRFEGDHVSEVLKLTPETRTFRGPLPLRPGRHCAAVRLRRVGTSYKDTSAVKMLKWRVTGSLRAVDAAAGSIVLRHSGNLPVALSLDGASLPNLEAEPLTIERVAAGRHKLRSNPAVWGRVMMHTIELDIKAGQAVELDFNCAGDLRRHNKSPNGYWDVRQVSTAYNPLNCGPYLGQTTARPGDVRLLVEEDQWIAVWSMRHDLYLARSTDRGQTWSATRQLPQPVNSAHDERLPLFTRDSGGRYLLAFVSDRNLAHASTTYVCYSYDLQSFSAPVMLSNRMTEHVALVERPDGLYMCYVYVDDPVPGSRRPDGSRHRNIESGCYWGVQTSTDLIHWTEPVQCVDLWLSKTTATQNKPWPPAKAAGFCFDGNKFWSFAWQAWELRIARSSDGIHFSPPSEQESVFGPKRSNEIPNSNLRVEQIHFQRAGRRWIAVIQGDYTNLMLLELDSTGESWRQTSTVSHNSQIGYHTTPGTVILREQGVDFLALPEIESPYDLRLRVFGPWTPSAFYAAGPPLVAHFVPFDDYQVDKKVQESLAGQIIDANIAPAADHPATPPAAEGDSP